MGHFWDWTFFLGRAIERDLDRHAADAMGFEQPKMDCPRCGKVYEDFDGFGVVYCAPPDGCGYCRHLARSGNGGKWTCDFCGEAETRTPTGTTPGGTK